MSTVAKPTKKQKAQRTHAEREKYKRRIAKATQSLSQCGGQSKEDVDQAILMAHLDRMASLLPRANHSSLSMPTQPNKRPWKDMPYSALKRNVGWIPTNKQDNYINPKSIKSKTGDTEIRALVLKRFNEEILEFSSYVELTQGETINREGVLSDLYDAVIAKWPNATVSAFGSYASGLSIFNSDLDITVEGIGVAINDKGKHVDPQPTTTLGMSVLSAHGTKMEQPEQEQEQEQEEEQEEEVVVTGLAFSAALAAC